MSHRGKGGTRKRERDFSSELSGLSYKSRRVTQDSASVGLPVEITNKTGGKFAKHIRKMTVSSNKSVTTSVDLNVSKTSDSRQYAYPLRATFSVDQHASGLPQGMMKSNTYTAYENLDNAKRSVLPVDLSLDRARLESRVMKALSPHDGDYDSSAKRSVFDELTLTKNRPTMTTAGGIALGSFLEDITAGRAVGLRSVGSAMRATVMAAKWTMQLSTDANPTTPGFRESTMESFPQLGNSKRKIGTLEHSGISALRDHWSKPDGEQKFTKPNQLEKIDRAHENAYQAAHNVFKDKFGRSDAVADGGGKWWADNREKIDRIKSRLGSRNATRVEKGERKLAALSEAYMARKLSRHGIEE